MGSRERRKAMSKGQSARSSEQGEMNDENKTCFDCLYCKVSAKSTENRKLFFCSGKRKQERHRESYWLERKLCSRFDDMSA